MRRTTTATTMRQQTTEHCPYLKSTGCLHEISSTLARIDRLCSGTAFRADNFELDNCICNRCDKHIHVFRSGQTVVGRCNSTRFPRCVFHSCVGCDPVYFPSFSAVIRKRLFKTTRGRGDVRNNESDKNHSPIQRFLIEELPTSIFEFPNRGLG